MVELYDRYVVVSKEKFARLFAKWLYNFTLLLVVSESSSCLLPYQNLLWLVFSVLVILL